MVAKVTLIGNLGKDPEIKNNADKKMASLSLAVTKYRNKEKTTMWVNVVCFDPKKCDVIESFARKGTKIYVEGELNINEYTDKEGNKRTGVNVVISNFNGELQLLSRADEAAKSQDPREAVIKELASDVIPF